MRSALVVLSRGQASYAEELAGAIGRQTVLPDAVLVVLDRPKILEANATRRAYAPLDGCRVIMVDSVPERMGRPPMNGVQPFCAGHCRDTALSYLDSDWGGYDLAIFTDGDCIPEPGLVESHLAAYAPGRVTVGRRRELKWDMMDQRQVSAIKPIDIFGKEPREVTSEAYFADSGVMWTCNAGITREAAGKLREINSALYGSATVFHPGFSGRWGGEDGFLGLECFYGGIPVWTAPATGNDGVRHIDHPRPLAKYDLVHFHHLLESRRRELVVLMSAAGMYEGDFVPLEELLKR